MNFVPVIIMSLILLAITVLLAIADRLLVNYGVCKITVNQEGERKEFLVQGGDHLLASLTQNNVNVSSSCGGKGTCGYCKVKVLSGGGEILPTEEIFMSREEKRDSMRLACQVKVKDDIEVYIPDLLATVRSMVENETYDPKLRWRWIRANIAEEGEARIRINAEDRMRIYRIIDRYKSVPGPVVSILREMNVKFSYLPEPALRAASEHLNIPLSELLRIATFYDEFSLTPVGRYVITVCLGTTCYVKGAAGIVAAFEKELRIKTGETTGDMLFTLKTVRCLGCCNFAPVVKINGDVYNSMTKEKVSELIKKYRGASVDA